MPPNTPQKTVLRKLNMKKWNVNFRTFGRAGTLRHIEVQMGFWSNVKKQKPQNEADFRIQLKWTPLDVRTTTEDPIAQATRHSAHARCPAKLQQHAAPRGDGATDSRALERLSVSKPANKPPPQRGDRWLSLEEAAFHKTCARPEPLEFT